MGPTVYVYDRWGAQTGVLAGLLSLVRVAEVNGEDALKVTSMTSLAKGQRQVVCLIKKKQPPRQGKIEFGGVGV